MKHDRVRDWMTPNPFTVAPSTRLSEAYRLMQTHHIRRLPVVAEGRLVGIVTMSDLREAGAEVNDEEAHKKRVDIAMHEQPFTIAPEAALSEAAEVMLRHKIGGLPVVSDDTLIGIITESDLLRAMLTELGKGSRVGEPVEDLGEAVMD